MISIPSGLVPDTIRPKTPYRPVLVHKTPHGRPRLHEHRDVIVAALGRHEKAISYRGRTARRSCPTLHACKDRPISDPNGAKIPVAKGINSGKIDAMEFHHLKIWQKKFDNETESALYLLTPQRC